MFRDWRNNEKRFFDEFEKELEGMNELIDSMMQNLGKGTNVYGFSMMVGPDGVPHVEHFGKVNPVQVSENRPDAVREPFTSSMIDEKRNELNITAEMPGLEKENIVVNATDNEVIIKGEGGGRKYYKSLQTPPVDPESSTAKYNNGVLEVTLRLKDESKPKGKTVKIE